MRERQTGSDERLKVYGFEWLAKYREDAAVERIVSIEERVGRDHDRRDEPE